MGVFGDTLRQARAHKGVTLREAEVSTRINRHWLLALEEEHFDQLPALIYQRGIVRNYATYLSLDQAKLLDLFADARGDRAVDEPSVLAPPMTISPAGSFVPNFAVIAFVVVAMGAVFAWGYSAYFNGGTPGVAGTGSVPTATALADEERFIATNTAVPPTNTPLVEPTESAQATVDDGLIQIRYPTVTTTAETITIGGPSQDEREGIAEESQVVEVSEVAETPTSANTEYLGYSFNAESDLYLVVVADNVVVWDGALAAGQVTGYLYGTSFVVSVSGADSIAIVDDFGEYIVIEKTEFTLP